MSLLSCRVLTLILITAALASCVLAQSSVNHSDWETLRPEKELFSVLIPKGSTYEEASKVPYHKLELNTRFYVSRVVDGPVYAVVSLSGIKSNPAAYTELQRVNSYVDAFKKLFVPKIQTKPGLAQLTLVRERTLQGNPGREYRLVVGNLTGTVHAYATSRRFYAIVYLNSKKDEALQDRFLSSFVLPDKIHPAAPPMSETAIAAPEPMAETPISKPEPDQPETKQEGPESARQADGVKGTSEGFKTPEGMRPPISGGVLNGKAINLPAPEYPATAKQARVSGAVTVRVTVDENGAVISAQAVSGHPLLQAAAVQAARQARFSPTLLMGEPVKITGVIIYNFGEPMN